MRKLCPHCFNFVSVKKGEDCPVCHRAFKTKEKKATQIKTSYTEEPERVEVVHTGEAVAAQIKDDAGKAAPVDQFHQKNGRVKWVSRRVREGRVKAPRKVLTPRVSGVHIDVESSSYFARSKNKYTPSTERLVIENNGKYEIEKLKWWEIYKWADRQLAKNKIKKVVKKEAVKKPERVSFWVLLTLCLFSGFLGVHNFYAGNWKRGLVSAISFAIAMIFVVFLDGIAFFNTYMQGIMCAVPGLVCMFIWLTDFVAIVLRRFKFRTSRLEYIKTLDLETRARLGKKYIYIV